MGEALKFSENGLFARKNELLKNALKKECPLDEVLDLSSKERAEKQEHVQEALRVLSSWFRDLFLAKVSPGSEGFINNDRKSDIVESARLFSYAELEERLVTIAAIAKDLGRNINTRIALTKMRVDLWK